MVPLLLGALALIGLVYASVLVRTARAKGAFGFGAEGVALGHAVLHEPRVVIENLIAENVPAEKRRLEDAVAQLRAQLAHLVFKAAPLRGTGLLQLGQALLGRGHGLRLEEDERGRAAAAQHHESRGAGDDQHLERKLFLGGGFALGAFGGGLGGLLLLGFLLVLLRHARVP